MITAEILTIIHTDEAEELILKGIYKSHDEVNDVHSLANEILTNRCSPICIRRVSDSDGPEAFVCRKPNNCKQSPDKTQTFSP